MRSTRSTFIWHSCEKSRTNAAIRVRCTIPVVGIAIVVAIGEIRSARNITRQTLKILLYKIIFYAACLSKILPSIAVSTFVVDLRLGL